MNMEIVEHNKALHGDDADAKAVAWLHYGIGYLADALKDYEDVLASLESDDNSDADVIEKRAKASMVTAKRYLSRYHNRKKEA